MGIEDIQISGELETNAPSITYTGNEGPKSPQEEQEMAMKMAMAMEAEENQMAMAEKDMMVKEDYSSRAYRDKLIQQLMDTGGYDYGSAVNEADRIIEIKLRPKAAFGGIMGRDGRRQYGLGSKFKKFVRKVIPNEVAEIAEKAAPFIALAAPQFALPAALAGGLGSFDRTGKIGSSLMSGLSTYGLGQISPGLPGLRNAGPSTGMFSKTGAMGGKYNLSNIMAAKGNAVNQTGKQSLTTGIDRGITADAAGVASRGGEITADTILNSPSSIIKGNQARELTLLDKFKNFGGTALQYAKDHPYQAILAASAAGGLYTKFGGEDETVDAIMDRGEGLDISSIRTEVTEAFKDPSGKKLAALRTKYPYLGTQASKNTAIMADGGRIGLEKGGGLFEKLFANKSSTGSGVMSAINTSEILDVLQMLQGIAFAKGGRAGFKNGGLTEYESYRLKNMGYDTKGGTVLEPFGGLSVLKDILRVNKAMGGMTSRMPMEEGGIMDLGGMEKDYRAEGGFVPIGKKEKADDVPARLSVNEFVFTADAVRNAGGGDIDKGAEVMENMMKNLEAGGEVSEESQGMQGARDMFQTSQSLEGVM